MKKEIYILKVHNREFGIPVDKIETITKYPFDEYKKELIYNGRKYKIINLEEKFYNLPFIKREQYLLLLKNGKGIIYTKSVGIYEKERLSARCILPMIINKRIYTGFYSNQYGIIIEINPEVI